MQQKVASGMRVADVIRILVNASDLNIFTYGNETSYGKRRRDLGLWL